MEAMIDSKVDSRLMRAMREGAAALPADLGRLHEYLMLIGGLLGEKAVEHEETWALALAAGAEIETLQNLEHAVTDKAIVVPARELSEVLTKFASWNALVAAGAAPVCSWCLRSSNSTDQRTKSDCARCRRWKVHSRSTPGDAGWLPRASGRCRGTATVCLLR
jgi:hypothetical protein